MYNSPKILGKLSSDHLNFLSSVKNESISPIKNLNNMFKTSINFNNNKNGGSFLYVNNTNNNMGNLVSVNNSKITSPNNTNINNNITFIKNLNKNINSDKIFCPHCDHCNLLKDDYLEKYLNMKEAKDILKKSLEYILNNYQTDQCYLDFLFEKNNPTSYSVNHLNNNNLNSNSKTNPNSNPNTNNNPNHNPNPQILNFQMNSFSKVITNTQNLEIENPKNNKLKKFSMEDLLNDFPKNSNNRTVLKLVTYFLDALVDDKISLDSIAGPELLDNIKDSLIAQGNAFKINQNDVEFDKELELLLDETTKEKLRKIYNSK
jgi:hypothetical protein